MEKQVNTTASVTAPVGGGSQIAKNFMFLSIAAIAGRLAGLFTGIYARRVLEVAVMGQVSWCASVLGYFHLVTNPGLETIAKRDVARNPSRAGSYLSVLLTIQLVLAVASFSMVAVIVAMDLRPPEVNTLLLLQAIGLFLTPLNINWLLHAHERMAPPAVAEVISQALMVPALIGLVRSPEDVNAYVLLGYPFRVAVIVFNFWYAGRRGFLHWPEIRPSLKGAGLLLKQAVPLGLSQVAVVLYYSFDVVFLGFLRDDVVVGLYSTAYHFMMIPLFLSSSLAAAYFPAMSRIHNDPDACARVSSEFLRLLGWLGLPIAALGWAFGRHVVVLIYGDSYADAGILSEWLALNVALVFFNVGMGHPLLAWGHQLTHLRITVCAATVNVGLNFWLIPLFGAFGAVITTILSEIVVAAGCVLARRRRVPAPWRKSIANPLLTALVIGSAAKFLALNHPDGWWYFALASLLAFACCVWWAEKEVLHRLLNRYLFNRT